MPKTEEPANPEQRCTPEEWAAHVARVKAARGKFAHMFSTIDAFNRHKLEEIDLEEEQSYRRRSSS